MIDMTLLKTKVIAHATLSLMANEIESEFEDEGLSKKCEFQKVWIDPFDGEPIPRCHKNKVGKGKRRPECTITNCPFHKEAYEKLLLSRTE
jgi:hypothetical protein